MQNSNYPNFQPKPPKDRSIALILEILPGLFGFLGFGWIYAGNTATGVLWLVGYMICNILMAVGDAMTAGLLLCVHFPLAVGMVAVSAMGVNGYAKGHPELFGR
jgi:hypothetical protein